MQEIVPRNKTVDRRVEQRLGSFQVLTSDSGYLDAGTFILHGADACVSGAVDRYRTSPAVSKLRAEGSMGRNGHRKSKRDKRTGEPSESRWSSSSMDIGNPREVTSALSTFQVGVGYLVDGEEVEYIV
ncbi:hypothetical protein EVAR_64074_1 [Eumeta japonica]|uniref:Uncharacterized protein n=1 Tax=Eumeta variegata TaxID=151549 RepID=A0A4C1ZEA0_EUMVA|nr:hypothetical protein EVAR_64074_1 [Eumeta japonica]